MSIGVSAVVIVGVVGSGVSRSGSSSASCRNDRCSSSSCIKGSSLISSRSSKSSVCIADICICSGSSIRISSHSRNSKIRRARNDRRSSSRNRGVVAVESSSSTRRSNGGSYSIKVRRNGSRSIGSNYSRSNSCCQMRMRSTCTYMKYQLIEVRAAKLRG